MAKQSEEAKRQEPATTEPPPWMAGVAVGGDPRLPVQSPKINNKKLYK